MPMISCCQVWSMGGCCVRRVPMRIFFFTNKPPCGPKRGHGTTQPRCAVEVHMDKLAHDLGLDPAEFRRRNLVEPYSRTVNGLRITSCALDECLNQVTARSGWNESRSMSRRPRFIGGTADLSASIPS